MKASTAVSVLKAQAGCLCCPENPLQASYKADCLCQWGGLALRMSLSSGARVGKGWEGCPWDGPSGTTVHVEGAACEKLWEMVC